MPSTGDQNEWATTRDAARSCVRRGTGEGPVYAARVIDAWTWLDTALSGMPLRSHASDTLVKATVTGTSCRRRRVTAGLPAARSDPFVMSVECPAAHRDERRCVTEPRADRPRHGNVAAPDDRHSAWRPFRGRNPPAEGPRRMELARSLTSSPANLP